MDTPLVKRAYNLGLKAVPNFLALTEAEIFWYEQHLEELPAAICRGFVLPQSESVEPSIVAPPIMFSTTDTDPDQWLREAEKFAKDYLGVEIRFRERFAIPDTLPWRSVIPVFDPGGLTNRDAVEKALKSLGLAVYEEMDVVHYSGSGANDGPTLHFINNSIEPDEDTMNMSPDQLVARGKNWLSQRGYAFALGLHYSVTRQYLDPRTFTWFPNNRLPSGKVAFGDWHPGSRRVGFSWDYPDCGNPCGGARLAIQVPLLA